MYSSLSSSTQVILIAHNSIMSNYSIQMPESLDVVKDEQSFGTFVLQPMERGFGVTIGNSFRQVLLSSLPSTAITAIKISGVIRVFQYRRSKRGCI